jgi:hypothetical protein
VLPSLLNMGIPPNVNSLGCPAVFVELNLPCPYKFVKPQSQRVTLGICASRRIFRVTALRSIRLRT